MGHLRRIHGAGAVCGPPPIATDRRAAIRAAVRSNGPIAAIHAPSEGAGNDATFNSELPAGRAEV
jgi:hypothetical protein